MIDGKRQREALSSAERAIGHLAAGKYEEAVRAAGSAAEKDQVAAFATLPDAVQAAATELAAGGLTPETRDRLLGAVGPGPLRAGVEGL